MMTKILLADDHTLFIEGMTMIIKRVLPDAQVVSVNDWQQVHTQMTQDHYQLALLDLFMPRIQSWEQELSQLIANTPDVPICIITASTVQSHIKKALAMGVKGFIHKTANLEQMQTALLTLQQGKKYLPPLPHNPAQNTNHFIQLSERQKEVLALLSQGKTNQEIGLQLNISEATTKRHVYNLYRKLGIKNRMGVNKIIEAEGLLFK